MLGEVTEVEQCYPAVREALDSGVKIIDVVLRYGVGRATVHKWLVRYANGARRRCRRCPQKRSHCPVDVEIGAAGVGGMAVRLAEGGGENQEARQGIGHGAGDGGSQAWENGDAASHHRTEADGDDGSEPGVVPQLQRASPVGRW